MPFVNALVVLDSDGDRLLAKYYDQRSKTEQAKTEQFLHKKTKAVRTCITIHFFPHCLKLSNILKVAARSDAEVLLMDNEIVVFRSGNDCKFYISGPSEENELILVGILDVVFDTGKPYNLQPHPICLYPFLSYVHLYFLFSFISSEGSSR